MSFTNTPPNWRATGVTPPESLQISGFQSGYKPPAEYFNWFWTKVSKCLAELQTVIDELDIDDVSQLRNTLNGLRTDISSLQNNDTKLAVSGVTSGDDPITENILPTLKGRISTNATNITALQNSAVGEKSGTNNGERFNKSGSATGAYAHAENYNNTASGDYSHCGGNGSEIAAGSGGTCAFAHGDHLQANAYQAVFGGYNTGVENLSLADANSAALLVGFGTSSTDRKNIFRVNKAGKVYGLSAYAASGADYAELFEWQDGNPDEEVRRGLFVTLDGEKIRLANANDDYILGVISANPSVVGDIQSEHWKDRYLTDVFGSPIYETVDIDGEQVTRQAINPEYDPTKPYVSRENRKEWATVGLLGKLVVVDDGTCQPNGYCKPSNGGVATATETGYRVMSRIDNNHIRILLK